MIIIYIILSIFFDSNRYRTSFSSENKNFTIKLIVKNKDLIKTEKWTLFNNNTNKAIYSIHSNFSFKTVLVSDDGENLIVINDWPYKTKSFGNVKAIEFYKSGKLKNEFSIKDMLNDTTNISSSVSHFKWCKKFTISDNKFKIKTRELIQYYFDISGYYASAKRDKILKKNAIYVYGKVLSEEDKIISFKVYKSIQGDFSRDEIIKFTFKGYNFQQFRENGKVVSESMAEGIAPNEIVSIVIVNGNLKRNTNISYDL